MIRLCAVVFLLFIVALWLTIIRSLALVLGGEQDYVHFWDGDPDLWD